MTDHPFRDELRAAVPTLEPDEAFLAQLSARAAAGATTAAPAGTAGGWRVALAPVAVAAVLVGIAWLTGLRPSGITDPTPAPQPTDSTTHSTTHSPSPGSTPRPASSTSGSQPAGAPGARPSTSAASPGSGAAGPAQATGGQAGTDDGTGNANPGPAQAGGNGQGAEHANGHANGHPDDQANGHANGQPKHPPQPQHTRGPDDHAGDHPATQAGQDRHPE